ncbi:MAG: hypothetical protein AVDCRST_MAG75-1131 [uncultured Propionibacteriaceae bacterium]|uniref:Uncharacterized protein n=1 Tax=uncultured Propionibacteriaceae bacterium TaxID=257457 RepID=A0A6J4NBT7_9ACTN|nr:MAG: hypothetical protein AVDCRST_MAG75-1131 [uncultured Propionibacteriaceae bacterium]
MASGGTYRDVPGTAALHQEVVGRERGHLEVVQQRSEE